MSYLESEVAELKRQLDHQNWWHRFLSESYESSIKEHERTILQMDARIDKFKHEIELDERTIQAYRLLLHNVLKYLSEGSTVAVGELVEELKKIR